MRVIVEIVHPADALFFKRPIEMLTARGDDVLILSRHKDIACDLLDGFGFEHRPLTTAATGTAALAAELARRDLAVMRAARNFRPDVMIGFGGVAISHAGWLLRIPSVSFYDSENATLQTRLTWPFISQLYVPEAYAGQTPTGRTTRLAGVKELSFLHPSGFTPSRETALAAGLDPETDNFLVRVVAWRANHDIGKSGWPESLLRAVIARLSEIGTVHVSAERALPDDLAGFTYRGPRNDVHHLLAHCRALVGESATMASEAAVLGVPAIYAGRDFPGYVRDLETRGLIRNLKTPSETQLMEAVETVLQQDREQIKAARDRFVADCPDWADAVVAAIDRYGT